MFTGLLFRSLCELLWAPSAPKKLAGAFFEIRPKLAEETKSRAAVDNLRNFNVLKARS